VHRAAAAVVSLLLIGATLWPLVRTPYDDGFPLSTYPMFASRRPTLQTYSYALGQTATGQRRTLEPAVVGSHEILQALRIIERAVAGPKPELAQLCDVIAARVAADDDFTDVVSIRIVTGTHEAVEYLARDRIGTEVERARCAVRR
jgi:hypothetical protein